MPSHYWGDPTVDWKGINDAAYFIHDYCVRWGRFGGQAKEKFGCVRFYTDLGYISLHSLIFPGRVWIAFPKWLNYLDFKIITPILNFTLGWLIRRWQRWIYTRAYTKALYKWPHLRAEILIHADYLEWIPGASKRIGNETHVLGWNGETVGKLKHFI